MSGYPQYPPQSQPAPSYGQPQQPYPGQPLPSQTATNPFADQPVNPYAAPTQAGYYPQMPMKLSPFAGLWREGNVLVMHKLAPLPDICLKSNEPAIRRLKRNVQWHHPAVFLALLVNIIVYAVVAMIMTKKATIYVALTDEWFAIRKRRMILAWCLVLLSVALFAVSLTRTALVSGSRALHHS